jgi:seryl-tRNA synthetase
VTKTAFPQSSPPRDAAAIENFARIDAGLQAVAAEFGASAMSYPTLIAREALVRAGYPDAFPHLLMLATNLARPERSDLLDPPNLDSPQWCLSPAVCYHVYAQFAGQRFTEPTIVSAGGRCFRHESSTEPGRRQIEFEMREIVLLGDGEWVRATATDVKHRVENVARRLELEGEWRIAEDPFFLPRAQGQALMQRLKETKLEYCRGDGEESLALASVNFHEDFFGKRFDIRTQGGGFIHTACVAAGVDRWVASIHQQREEVCSCHPRCRHKPRKGFSNDCPGACRNCAT